MDNPVFYHPNNHPSMQISRIELAPGYSISRILKGGWHLAGGHGTVDQQQAIEDMRAFVAAGVTTFDCADIYTGVEQLIGKFLKTHRDAFRNGTLPPVQIHTKYVPDYDKLSTLRPEDTTAIIDRSLKRLGVDQLDLVQFSWWDYKVPGYVEAALHLQRLQQEGKIRYLGVTNFDALHLQEMIDAGVNFLANQVQFSILDRRPVQDMHALARKENIPYLCYGVVAGGFLSDRYLNQPDPPQPLENRSLTKYRLIIEEFGGYAFFQETLRELSRIAHKHQVGIAEVASRFMLQEPLVAGVIIGARNQQHLKKIQVLDGFSLDAEDMAAIHALIARAKGPSGPVFGLERDKTGKHGSIMKYNLNESTS